MTSKESARKRCGWCGTSFEYKKKPGRPPLYCKASHRQRQHEARRKGENAGVPPGQLLVNANVYADFRDALYRLEAAAEDATSDSLDLQASPAILDLFDRLAKAVASTVAQLPRPSAEG
jgi:hypothetical protein